MWIPITRLLMNINSNLNRIVGQPLQLPSRLLSEVTVFGKGSTGSCLQAAPLGPLLGRDFTRDLESQGLGHQSHLSTPPPGILWSLMKTRVPYLISVPHTAQQDLMWSHWHTALDRWRYTFLTLTLQLGTQLKQMWKESMNKFRLERDSNS